MKNLLSLERTQDSKYLIIHLFGLKIKFSQKHIIKNHYQHTFWKIQTAWKTFHYDSILNECDLIMDNKDYWNNINPMIWIIFMMVLLQHGKIDTAKTILRRYVKYYQLKNLDLYLPVAALAHECGYDENRFEKEYFVYKKLEFNPNFSNFLTHVKNKKIAIVGNSSHNIGKNTGSEIDNHDIVIRFNNYPSGYETDYGSKTNIWCRGIGSCQGDVKHRNIDCFDYIFWYFDIWHFPIKFNTIDILYDDLMKYSNRIIYIPEDPSKYLLDVYDVNFPTSGALMITLLMMNKIPIDEIDIYGFSFLDKLDSDGDHYYDSNCRINIAHNMHEERLALREMYKNKYN